MADADDIRKLKADTFFHLGIGITPLSQWAHVFANPDLVRFPGLRCKAFTVWFGTVIDYLRNWQKLNADLAALEDAGVDADEVREIATQLHDTYSELASLHSRDTQVFLRDRRLQNVHGRLDIYARGNVGISWYDGTTIKNATITADEYRDTLVPYYEADMQAAEMQALEQTLNSGAWHTLAAIYLSKLDTQKLMQLGERFGVV